MTLNSILQYNHKYTFQQVGRLCGLLGCRVTLTGASTV